MLAIHAICTHSCVHSILYRINASLFSSAFRRPERAVKIFLCALADAVSTPARLGASLLLLWAPKAVSEMPQAGGHPSSLDD